LKRTAIVAFLMLSLSLFLTGAALGLEVGHVSESFDETMNLKVSVTSGDAEPLGSTDPLLGDPISLDGSWSILGAFSADSAGSALAGTLSDDTGATNLLAYNFDTNQWDDAPTGVVTTAAGGSFPFYIADNGPYDQQGITSNDITAYFMAVKPMETPTPSGGGGGGCAAAILAPAALFLLAPLFVLRKRR
jgi:Synergist-CTERM protein sorting domain-containing protein